MTLSFPKSRLLADPDSYDMHRVEVKLFGFYRFLHEGQERPCETVAASLDAISLRAASRGKPGSWVFIQLDLFDRVEGRVTRHTPEGFVVTLYLDEVHRAKITTRLHHLVHRSGSSASQRRDVRIVPVAPLCCVTFPDGTRHDVKIIDVSRSGVALRSIFCPPIRSRLSVGSRGATVVRHIREGFAVEFDERIPPTDFDENIIV
jgi:hypothetical protein